MPVASQRSLDIGRSLTRSSLAVISDTTRPAPSAAASRRNGASVMPDIGASSTGFAIATLPILKDLALRASEPVTDFSFSKQRPHRRAEMDFEHKCCAVKIIAYTLNSSPKVASALQQNRTFQAS